MTFSGSYRATDVTFLLKPTLATNLVAVPQKERLIQSGARHYSEMLTPEELPSPAYMRAFHQAWASNQSTMARDCLRLAGLIAQRRSGAVTVVSLARAGTPVGIAVSRLLSDIFGREVRHYSVSIIRDRGIDAVALRHILATGHAPESLVFVDGWTGKGVIGDELARAITDFNQRYRTAVCGDLFVLADLAGTAACAATCEDYLIPSSILNATISGLVSRSILDDTIGPDDFHGCAYYDQFTPYDLSQRFVDELVDAALVMARGGEPLDHPQADNRQANTVARQFLADTMREHDVGDVNHVKPGIGEATRALLRRATGLLLLRDADAPEVAHLQQLARDKQVGVRVVPTLPYKAVSLIASVGHG